MPSNHWKLTIRCTVVGERMTFEMIVTFDLIGSGSAGCVPLGTVEHAVRLQRRQRLELDGALRTRQFAGGRTRRNGRRNGRRNRWRNRRRFVVGTVVVAARWRTGAAPRVGRLFVVGAARCGGRWRGRWRRRCVGAGRSVVTGCAVVLLVHQVRLHPPEGYVALFARDGAARTLRLKCSKNQWSKIIQLFQFFFSHQIHWLKITINMITISAMVSYSKIFVIKLLTLNFDSNLVYWNLNFRNCSILKMNNWNHSNKCLVQHQTKWFNILIGNW